MESLKRLVTVLFAPTETFRKISERPTWAAALIVLLVIGGATSWIALQRIDVDAQRQMMRDTFEERQGLRGQELDQQVDRAMAINQKLAPFFPVFGLVFSVAAYAVVALVFYIAFRLAGGEVSYLKSLSTTLYGLVPLAVSGLIAIPILLNQGSIDPEKLQSGSLLASSLASFAPEGASRLLVVFLASLDLFTLWAVVLLVIGYSVVARVSRGVAAGVVGGAWVVWIGVKVGLAALGGMFGG